MGRYTPLARLGHGGMADVFLAVARGPMGFNKLTVVKRLRNSEEAHVKMFLDEARLAARLNHPNIVHTYEVGEVGGKFFIAMEYLEGQSVNQLIAKLTEKGEGLSEPMIAYLGSLALKGLHHAHELRDFDGTPIGVVHRDISPQNLFITYTGEVKLLDFGIAKATVNSSHTDTGVLKGKVRYMAPEQVASQPVDRRLDVFAFGVVMWELLARRHLFQGDAISILTRIASDPLPSVRSVRPEISTELDTIVLRALRQDPAERYQTADAMRADLDQFQRGHDPAALERELVQLMNNLFAETRDGVRARIQAFLANVTSGEETPSVPGIGHSGELPALLGDSGAVPIATTSATTVSNLPASSARRPIRRRSPLLLVAIAAVLVVAAVGAGILLRARSTPSAVASPAPLPTTARVRVETTPPGALIEWNGRPIDRSPADLTLEPGPQTLVLSREGYETVMLAVDAKAGDNILQVLQLTEKAPAAAPPATSATAAVASPPAVLSLPSRGWTLPRPPRPAASAPPPTTAATTAAPPTQTAPTARPKIKVLDDTP